MSSFFEPLEPRQLMAASPPAADITFLRGGLLLIRNAHNIHVQEWARSQVVVSDLSDPTNHQTFEGVTSIIITGTGGADHIELADDSIPCFVSAGDGNDVILVSGDAPVMVYGGNGNDTVRVGGNILPSRGSDRIEPPDGF